MEYNILIPGAGGPAAIGAIKSLRMANFKGKIVSTDCNPLSAGFYLADKHYIIPPVKDPTFFLEAQKVIHEEDIHIILPTSGFDIVEYSRHKEQLQNSGVHVVMTDLASLSLCLDKWDFYQKTKDDFPLPVTILDPEKAPSPCFIKPRLGKGSNKSYICKDHKELSYYLSKYSDMIIQEYLPGEEYTVDVVSDLKGNPIIAIPRIRIETKAGISVKGKIIKDSTIQKLCLDMASALELKGPTCMQLKLDKDGRPHFLEVNPRMGGGTIFATFAGVNIPMIILDLIAGKETGILDFQEITVLRYFEEIVLDGQVN